MENKNELEIFGGIGSDEIEKRISEVEEKDIREEIDEAKKRLEELVEQTEDLRRKSYLEAYKNLSKDYQDKISKEDIENIVTGKHLSGEQYRTLEKERKEFLKKYEEELFDKFYEEMGGNLKDCKNKWNDIKRQILVGLIFGIPGTLFITVKDNIDKIGTMKKLKEATNEFVRNDNKDKVVEAENILNKKFGNIIDIKGFSNLVKSSDLLKDLVENEKELKVMVSIKKDFDKDFEKKIKAFQEDIETVEEQTEEIEDEEDPEPVEGFKLF